MMLGSGNVIRRGSGGERCGNGSIPGNLVIS